MVERGESGHETDAYKRRILFQELVETSPEAIYVHDDEKITYVNDAAVRLFGVASAKRLLGRSPYDLYAPEYREAMRERIGTLLAGGRVPIIEKKVLRADGSAIDVEVRAFALHGKERPVMQVLLLDITERKKNEEALRRQTCNLIAANRNLEAFCYSISHDLRNPLQGIFACCEVIEDALPAGEEDGHKALNHILAATRRMAETITGLMSLSKVTQQEMNVTRCALSDIAWSVVKELKEFDRERKVKIHIEPMLFADGDKALVWIVMQNLIDNAWKFTAERDDGRIEFGRRDRPGVPVYYVRDNGVGFDRASAEKLFTPFMRLHPGDKYAGSGIGLTIVKRIIERHGGTITVEAEKDKGATFYFSLAGGGGAAGSTGENPARDPARHGSPPTHPPTHPPSRR